jgi:geranylgeranyl pyrophosphate synthase
VTAPAQVGATPAGPASLAHEWGAIGPAPAAGIFAPIHDALVETERTIQAVAEVEHPLLRQTLRLILSAGGKRLRPALVLLAAALHHAPLRRRVDLAMAAELLHTATLIHDDVIDLAGARRGQVTVNAAFGNTLAVLTGDYLFGKSGELVAGLGSTAIMGVFSWAVMEVVQGEMLRPTLQSDLDATERDYLAKIRGKTAALLAMCAQTGAMLDVEDEVPGRARQLRDYGMSLGMAFQIVDDVLDYTATEEQLGKPVGSDLRQGTITLPAIEHLRQYPGDAVVRGLLSHDEAYAGQADASVEAICQSGATERALARARRYADDARRHLEGLPDGPAARAMRELTRYVVERHE